MKIDLKRLIISVLAWTVLNAGLVILFEAVIKNVTAEVAVSTAFSVLWLVYAAVFCRKAADTEE